MSDTNVIEPTDAEAEAPVKAKKGKAKADPQPEAQAVPEVLAETLAEEDSVLRAHKLRQQSYFTDLAPSIAKAEREEKERNELLDESARIQGEWEAKIAKEKAEQAAREEREGAEARIADLEASVADHQRQIDEATAEIDRLKKLVG